MIGCNGLLAVAEAHPLAHVDAVLNTTATVLLAAGYILIRRGHERAHRNVMLSAFCVSTVFLVCYLLHHWQVGSVEYQREGGLRWVYFPLLISHVILAAMVPPLAIATIYFGLRDQRRRHRRLARWTLPIWLYVSVTGVIVYAMLYYG